MHKPEITGDSIQAVALSLVYDLSKQKELSDPSWKLDEEWLATTYDRFCAIARKD